MPKWIYQATGVDGIVYERQTAAEREYKFAVVQRGKPEKTPPFCGRTDLAQAKKAEILRMMERSKAYWTKQGDAAQAAKYDGVQIDILPAVRIK